MNDDHKERRTPMAKPTEERTSEDLKSFKPGPGPELARERDVDDVLNRNVEKRYETPRRYEEHTDEEPRDPTMPANDSTLNTKI